MPSKTVLIVSNPQDEHTVRVSALIHELGAKPVLFFPEYLGIGRPLSIGQSMNKIKPDIMLMTESEAIDLEEVYSIWYRRPRLVSFDQEAISPEGVDFARDEWKAALEAVYALLNEKLWVSHPDRLRDAARKPIQLRIAQSLGFRTPRTLITNDAGKAKAFFDLCDGKVIVKATGSGWVYAQDGEDVFFVLTNRPSQRDIEASDEIALSPVTFQEEIPKAYEIRANIVGRKVLAIRIDSQNSAISELDWRRYDTSNTPYSPYNLPTNIENKCLRLAQALGLEFGAIDLIRQPNGEYVFLEINGNGQFLWAEELSGIGISNALASLLSGLTPPLKHANLSA